VKYNFYISNYTIRMVKFVVKMVYVIESGNVDCFS